MKISRLFSLSYGGPNTEKFTRHPYYQSVVQVLRETRVFWRGSNPHSQCFFNHMNKL